MVVFTQDRMVATPITFYFAEFSLGFLIVLQLGQCGAVFTNIVSSSIKRPYQGKF